jgi:membrane-anchored glycerophosphoryl diester phosphodiesterase (GDPDase)
MLYAVTLFCKLSICSKNYVMPAFIVGELSQSTWQDAAFSCFFSLQFEKNSRETGNL